MLPNFHVKPNPPLALMLALSLTLTLKPFPTPSLTLINNRLEKLKNIRRQRFNHIHILLTTHMCWSCNIHAYPAPLLMADSVDEKNRIGSNANHDFPHHGLQQQRREKQEYSVSRYQQYENEPEDPDPRV